MIEFKCPGCQKRFKVPDEFAGRQAKCKGCGQAITVPFQANDTQVQTGPMARDKVVSTSAAPVQLPMRIRRLISDAGHVSTAFSHSKLIRVISQEGNPPEVYRIGYRIKSLGPGSNPEKPVSQDEHEVEIQLTSDYPRMAPKCKMLTPIYHPNIDPSHICVGDHWAAGERLVDLIVRIGEMLAFQAYNIQSPLDAHAAMWADLNMEKLPTDNRTIRTMELDAV